MVTLALGAAFLALSIPHFDAPFANSHDGRNGATWGLASRALREDGIIDSRAGAELAHDNGAYARHPPLIVWETAVAEATFGEHGWSTRAPAWMSTLATLALLAFLLRLSGFSPLAAAVGVIVGGTTLMALLYGTMLDTPVTSLPVALGVLVLVRLERLGHPVPRWVMFAAALLAVLAGWQAALLAGLAAGIQIPGALRVRRPTSLQLGFVAGALTILVWLLWAHGGLGPAIDDLRFRTGVDSRPGRHSPGWWLFFEAQLTYSLRLLGVVGTMLLVPSCVAVACMRRFRPSGAILVVACLAYPVILREAAVNHDYWNFWLIAPLTLGAAALFDLLRVQIAGSLVQVIVFAIVGLGAATGLVHTAFAARETYSGQLATSVRLPESQPVAVAGSRFPTPPRWLAYATRRPLVELDEAEARHFGRDHPDALVLVHCDPPPTGVACDNDGMRFVAASELMPEPGR